MVSAPEWLLLTTYAVGWGFLIALFGIFTFIIVQAARTR